MLTAIGSEARPGPPRYDVLGLPIAALKMDEAVHFLLDRVRRREQLYVSVCNVHTVVEAIGDAEVKRAVLGAGLCVPDGMPLVWWGRLAGARSLERVYGPELMRRVLADPAHGGTRHFLYGGDAGVAERLVSAMRSMNPAVKIVGWFSPPFRHLSPEEEAGIAARIDAVDPDIVWVGLGCPKQDLWMARFRPRIRAPILIGVGAAFDFLSGAKRQAPAWMQRTGLEWAFRLACEPRRLWRRYLVGNSVFLAHAAAHALGLPRTGGRRPLIPARDDDPRE